MGEKVAFSIDKKLDIIAEVGVNHNGSVELARSLIGLIAKTGANICKFQYFTASELATKAAKKSKYQLSNNKKDNQIEMLQKLELKQGEISELIQECVHQNIEFLATAFSYQKLEWLLLNGQRRIKIASGDMNNPFLLQVAAEADCDVIMSSGMATITEVEKSIDFMVAKGLESSKLTILHCTSSYPAPMRSLNLLTISDWGKKIGCNIGFSDHSEGELASIAAVALGAKVIEKHVTYDRQADGPDHKASMEIEDFASFVDNLRSILPALKLKEGGAGFLEKENRINVRRSIVAKNYIALGEQFTESNIDFKRPGDGINPMKFELLVGLTSKRAYEIDEKIDEKEIR